VPLSSDFVVLLAGQGVTFATWVAALARDFRSAFDRFAMRTAKALALRGRTTACGIATFFLVGHDSSLTAIDTSMGCIADSTREKHFFLGVPRSGAAKDGVVCKPRIERHSGAGEIETSVSPVIHQAARTDDAALAAGNPNSALLRA